jgi:hypothetical protein
MGIRRREQRGQAMAEYFVVCGILLAALTAEVTMNGQTDTLLDFIIKAMQSEFAGFLYAVGQPAQP